MRSPGHHPVGVVPAEGQRIVAVRAAVADRAAPPRRTRGSSVTIRRPVPETAHHRIIASGTLTAPPAGADPCRPDRAPEAGGV